MYKWNKKQRKNGKDMMIQDFLLKNNTKDEIWSLFMSNKNAHFFRFNSPNKLKHILQKKNVCVCWCYIWINKWTSECMHLYDHLLCVLSYERGERTGQYTAYASHNNNNKVRSLVNNLPILYIFLFLYTYWIEYVWVHSRRTHIFY